MTSLTSIISLAKGTYDIGNIAFCLKELLAVPAVKSAEVLEALSVFVEVALKKCLAVISSVLNTISLIQACKDAKNGSKYAKQIRDLAYEL